MIFWSGCSHVHRLTLHPWATLFVDTASGRRARPKADDIGGAEVSFIDAGGGKQIGVIGLHGTVAHRPSPRFDTALQFWVPALQTLAADETVAAILIDVAAAPGGNVAGVNEAGRAIREVRETKPVTAALSGQVGGVAYELAAAASEVVITPSAMAGGLGFAAVHVDRSQANEKAGVAVSYITAGRYKVEGNPNEPLDQEARAEIQRHLRRYHAAQMRAVGFGRRMAPKQVRERFGQGRFHIGEDAVKLGMADRVGTRGEVVADLLARHRPPDRNFPASRRSVDLKRKRLELLRAKEEDAAKSPLARKRTRKRTNVKQARERLQADKFRIASLDALSETGTIPGIVVEGYAALCNVISKEMRDWHRDTYGSFLRFAPGAFRNARFNALACWQLHLGEKLLRTGDVLGSTENATLQFTATDEGLWFSLRLPDTRRGHAALRDIRKGGVRCSISFKQAGYRRFSYRGKPGLEWTDVGLVEDVTLTRSPCFPRTWCRVRRTEKTGTQTRRASGRYRVRPAGRV